MENMLAEFQMYAKPNDPMSIYILLIFSLGQDMYAALISIDHKHRNCNLQI